MNDSMLNVEREADEQVDKGKNKAKNSISDDIIEIDDTRRDAKMKLKRGTDDILSADSNEDIFYTDNPSKACFQFQVSSLGLP